MVSTHVTMIFEEDDCLSIITWQSAHPLTIDGAEAAAKGWAANHLLPAPKSLHIQTRKEKVT